MSCVTGTPVEMSHTVQVCEVRGIKLTGWRAGREAGIRQSGRARRTVSIEAVTICVGSSIDHEKPVKGAENSAFDCVARLTGVSPARSGMARKPAVKTERGTHVLQRCATDESAATLRRSGRPSTDIPVPCPRASAPVILLRHEVPQPERLGARREHLTLLRLPLPRVPARPGREAPAQPRRREPHGARRVQERRARDGAEGARAAGDALARRGGAVRGFRVGVGVVFEIAERGVDGRDGEVVRVARRVRSASGTATATAGRGGGDARLAVGTDGETE